MEILQPEVFVIENVKNLMYASSGWFRDEITNRIEKLGYNVSVDILTASDYGVPQTRSRVMFFICSKTKKFYYQSLQLKRR